MEWVHDIHRKDGKKGEEWLCMQKSVACVSVAANTRKNMEPEKEIRCIDREAFKYELPSQWPLEHQIASESKKREQKREFFYE